MDKSARSLTPHLLNRRVVPAVVLTALAGGAVGDDCDSCWDCFADSIADCQAVFPTPNDEAFRNACAQAAGLAYISCNSTVDLDELNAVWERLFIELQQCSQQFNDPVAQQMCIEWAMNRFREALENLTNPDPGDQACRDDAVSLESGLAIHTFEDVLNSDEPERVEPVYITSSVGQTVSLSGAGVGSTYNVSQMPCVRSVHLLATYQTKTGMVSSWVDHDMDPTDGTPLEVYLSPDTLVHADTVQLAALYMDSEGFPIMFESGIIVISDSPLTGDYNRDNATDAGDLLDYIDGYTGELRRADMNENGAVETTVLVEFVTDLSTGS